ncbi:MAG: response regulator [Polyangiaceae bacterium]
MGTLGAKQILLVEDNQDDELLTLRAFKKASVPSEVVVTRDGAEALDYLFGSGAYEGRDVSVQPQLVLLDLNLPRVNGLDVLRRIRADDRTKLLSVIILSSSKEERDLIGAYSLGANSYVRKPVGYNEFVAAVQTLSSYWLNLHELPSSLRRSSAPA